MPPETVKDWVLKIADAVETWPTVRPDSVEVACSPPSACLLSPRRPPPSARGCYGSQCPQRELPGRNTLTSFEH